MGELLSYTILESWKNEDVLFVSMVSIIYFLQNISKIDLKFDYSFDDSFSREEWLSCRAKLSSSQRGGATLLI